MKLLLLAFALLLPLVSTAGTTAEQARTMPMTALAEKLLGESGALMIDLDRPRFEGILEPVRFYSRATVTGSQFGICGSDWVTVAFDSKGEVETLSSQRRYGVAGDVYRAPGKWSYDESGQLCAAVTSTRSYFPAPDQVAAQQIAWYVDAIAGRGPFANQKFSYSCSGGCERDRGDLKWLALDKISSAKTIDCPKTTLERPACFELVVGTDEVGPFPKRFRVFGTTYMRKIVVTNVVVAASSTLE